MVRELVHDHAVCDAKHVALALGPLPLLLAGGLDALREQHSLPDHLQAAIMAALPLPLLHGRAALSGVSVPVFGGDGRDA